MGQKSKRLNVDNTIRDQYGRVNNQADTFQNRIAGRYDQANDRSNLLYNNILDRANQGAGASYSPEDFESYGLAKGMTGANGGIDPSRISSIDENIAGYKDIGRTGGWSDADKANVRLKASRTPTAFYTNLRNDMERRKNATGGYAPGFGASAARNTRESARAAADATLDSEVGIADSVRSGKLAGLSGAQNAETSLINQIAGNQRFGIGAMSQDENMALDATQREKQAGLSQLAQLYGTAPGEIGQLLGSELEGMGLQGNQVLGLIGQQGNEDSRRWGRKGTVANSAGGGLATAAGGGAGGTGNFMNKPTKAA
jgi:hypothetical protein